MYTSYLLLKRGGGGGGGGGGEEGKSIIVRVEKTVKTQVSPFHSWYLQTETKRRYVTWEVLSLI